MPHDIRVISASEFLRADIQGRVDLAASKKILGDLAAAVGGVPGRHVLIDAREADGTPLTSVDLYELVQALRGLGLGVVNRVAILRRPKDAFDRGRFFEMLATDRGFQFGVFEAFEEAFAWLHGSGQQVGPLPP